LGAPEAIPFHSSSALCTSSQRQSLQLLPITLQRQPPHYHCPFCHISWPQHMYSGSMGRFSSLWTDCTGIDCAPHATSTAHSSVRPSGNTLQRQYTSTAIHFNGNTLQRQYTSTAIHFNGNTLQRHHHQHSSHIMGPVSVSMACTTTELEVHTVCWKDIQYAGRTYSMLEGHTVCCHSRVHRQQPVVGSAAP
jgi:hypothetical protein